MHGRSLSRIDEELVEGKSGEAELRRIFPWLKESKDWRYDLFYNSPVRGRDITVELKTDSHYPGNLCVERYDDFKNRKPGGPSRSLMHGIDEYWAYYRAYKVIAIMNPSDIVSLTMKLFPDGFDEPINIPRADCLEDGIFTSFKENEGRNGERYSSYNILLPLRHAVGVVRLYRIDDRKLLQLSRDEFLRLVTARG